MCFGFHFCRPSQNLHMSKNQNRLAHCLPSCVKRNDKTLDRSSCSCLVFDNKGPYFEVHHSHVSTSVFSNESPLLNGAYLASPILKSYISLNSQRSTDLEDHFVKRGCFPLPENWRHRRFLAGQRLSRNHSRMRKESTSFLWRSQSKEEVRECVLPIYTEQPEMEFSYYLVNLIRVKSVKPTHISGMKYPVWLPVYLDQINRNWCQLPFCVCGTLAQMYSFCSKKIGTWAQIT